MSSQFLSHTAKLSSAPPEPSSSQSTAAHSSGEADGAEHGRGKKTLEPTSASPVLEAKRLVWGNKDCGSLRRGRLQPFSGRSDLGGGGGGRKTAESLPKSILVHSKVGARHTCDRNSEILVS